MKIHKIHFEQVDSTNTWSKQHLEEFNKDQLTLVTTDYQTKGRGRFNRQWISPAKQNIYATFTFFTDTLRKDLGNIPQVLAISAIKTLQDFNLKALIKWPNDLLISHKKVAGILCETTSWNNSRAVIIGIGINVNMTLEDLKAINQQATSLAIEAQQEYSTREILDKLTEQFLKDLQIFLQKGFKPFLNDYKNYFYSPSTTLRFNHHQEVIDGEFHSINEDGSLNLLIKGEIKRFISGEIE